MGQGRVERYWTVTPEKILRLRQRLPAIGSGVEYADTTLAAAQPPQDSWPWHVGKGDMAVTLLTD
ncbi:hypothetical protein [Erwinia endophytica]|uniref:hypothetical protein n=1 Tax=Erwinia endophytica TaxID=1563158 RepID=UPI001265EBEF|nr:hypothetical protein [Erwinia endophytica]